MDNPIKWSGSKKPLGKEILGYFPKKIKTYYEPFCGSCAIGLEILNSGDIYPEKIVFSDVNENLIALWDVIKNTPDELVNSYYIYWNKFNSEKREISYGVRIESIEEWRKIIYQTERETFNKLIRCKHKADTLQSRGVIFLNILRTSFNGLVRYNNKGEFNSPCHFTRPGMHPDTLSKTIYETSKILNRQNVEFKCCSYNEINPQKGDFVFLDPPYSSSKNAMYYGSIDEGELVTYLNNLDCGFCMTYNGVRGGGVVSTLTIDNVKTLKLNGKSSSFSRLKKRDVKVEEIFYIKN